MKTKHGIFGNPVKVVKLTASDKKKLEAIGENLKGKDVFKRANKEAEEFLKKVPNLGNL